MNVTPGGGVAYQQGLPQSSAQVPVFRQQFPRQQVYQTPQGPQIVRQQPSPQHVQIMQPIGFTTQRGGNVPVYQQVPMRVPVHVTHQQPGGIYTQQATYMQPTGFYGTQVHQTFDDR
jgi:hypothetical protein